MNIVWIRHGLTAGNREKRYIGKRTDEPLCLEGIDKLKKGKKAGIYPQGTRLLVSPMKRCLQTAEILYPDLEPLVCPGFIECDFGSFEGQTADELLESQEYYQRWIDSGGRIPFPEGESMESFRKRCVDAFWEVIEQKTDRLNQEETLICIVHGGTIMSILSTLGIEQEKCMGDYFSCHVGNGCGFYTRLLDGTTSDGKKDHPYLEVIGRIEI